MESHIENGCDLCNMNRKSQYFASWEPWPTKYHCAQIFWQLQVLLCNDYQHSVKTCKSKKYNPCQCVNTYKHLTYLSNTQFYISYSRCWRAMEGGGIRLGSGYVNNTSLVPLECGRLLRANFTGYEMVSVRLLCFMPHENIMQQLLHKWKYTIIQRFTTQTYYISTLISNKKQKLMVKA